MPIKFKQAYDASPDKGDQLKDNDYLPFEEHVNATTSNSWAMRLSQLKNYIGQYFYTNAEIDAKDTAVASNAQSQLDAHANNASNPHSVTAAQTGAATPADITAHDVDPNAHGGTLGITDHRDLTNIGTKTHTALETDITNLQAHAADTINNPHGINPGMIDAAPAVHTHTGEQVSYDNTSSGLESKHTQGAIDEIAVAQSIGVVVYALQVSGTGDVWTDTNAMDFTGQGPQGTPTNQVLSNHVVTIVHNGTSYDWVGGEKTLGAGGDTTVQADYAGTTGITDHGSLTSIGTKSHSQLETDITNLQGHTTNTANPHGVTAAQTGAATSADITAHAAETDVHGGPFTRDHTQLNNVGTKTHAQIEVDLTTALDHVGDTTGNPHNISAADVDAPDTATYNAHVNNTTTAHGGPYVKQTDLDTNGYVTAQSDLINESNIVFIGVNTNQVKDSGRVIKHLIQDEINWVPSTRSVFLELEYVKGQLDALTPDLTFSATIASDTTTAQLLLTGDFTYDRYWVTLNDPVVPTSPGTLGNLPATWDTNSWNSSDIRVYLGAGNDTPIPVPTSSTDPLGNPIYYKTVVPVSTIPPKVLSDFTVTEVGTGQMLITFGDATNASGFPIDRYDLYRTDTSGAVLYRSNVTSNETISNVTTGLELIFYVRAIDVDGKFANSNNEAITLTSGAGGTVGIAQGNYEVSEEGGATLPITLTVLDRDLGQGAFSVDVRTVNHTAIGGDGTTGNFTTITSQTVNFAEDDVSAVVNITIRDADMTQNVVGQLEIIPDSEGGTTPPTISEYPGNAVLFKILGSQAQDGDVFGEYTVNDPTNVTDAEVVCFEAEHFSYKHNYAHPDTVYWTEETDRTQAEGSAMDSNTINWSTLTPAQAADPANEVPCLHYKVNFQATGKRYIWIRGSASSFSGNQVFVGVNGQSNAFTLLVAETPIERYMTTNLDTTTAGERMGWEYHRNGDGGADEPITFNITAPGEFVFDIWQRGYHNYVDRICIADKPPPNFDQGQGVWSPKNIGADGEGNSEKVGPAESAYIPAGPVEDDPSNPTQPSVPIPGGVSYDPTSTSPAEGATGVPLRSTFTATWPVGAIVQNVSIVVKDSGGNVIAGTTS